MSDQFEPVAQPQLDAAPPTNNRILVILAVLSVVGGIAGALFVSVRFGAAVLFGGGLAFVNYFWLKRSLKQVFDSAESGDTPRFTVFRFLMRYLILGSVVALVYITGLIPITGLIFGIAGFGFAVLIEGFIRIFSSIFSGKEL